MTAAPAARPTTTDDGDWVHRLLDLARDRLGMDIAWLSVFTEDRQELTRATGDLASMHVAEGMSLPLEESFCVRVLSGQLPPVVTAADRNPVTRDLPVTRKLGIGSYVGAPVRAPDRRPVGMLCCLSRDPGEQLDGSSVRTVELLAELLGDHLAAEQLAERELAARRARVLDVLHRRTVTTAVQPVVDMATGEVVAHEALSRFPGREQGPATLFSDAAAVGLGVELEILAVRTALETAARLPRDLPLAVNLSPQALLAPEVGELLLRGAAGTALTVEVTEHSPIEDYPAVLAALEPLRRAGVLLGVDDAGAGYASLRHILRLRPDTIKLDIALVSRVDTDPARQAMTAALVAFAGETGAALVAEGVETPGERDALLARGVRLGQGHLFGRPAVPPT
ncbi:EAL domain, c-di-GMP-specific phosphodiesterase class I (or its enzymatically inactive variant) [Geodermatophilus dictyosporus]|uniref:EAL domain, c-di-GMP-specific phosphodiesterase class I (Or its enzymatically inactive variant) n=1 Tax=Geodermatophilus dictyosporus TaxID=1523247 RepID=A0A1I5KXB8_9ACTN|nr:EAL domain-containing protein [Geodermatophilus dictyosporus]SFO89552.1 EAL domain, c-di-GMP-specific phosphodiesterase class I (or its enzymatically inactive variant) [Geodermatophilus dictyosporus]